MNKQTVEQDKDTSMNVCLPASSEISIAFVKENQNDDRDITEDGDNCDDADQDFPEDEKHISSMLHHAMYEKY